LGGKFVVLPDLLRNVRRFVATLLACGVDGSSAVIYRQSAVPAHSELHWLLSCVTPLGRLQRMTQFKDKSAASAAAQDAADPPLALLAYPVLMAADILLFNATHVPVGDDQRQHLELCNAVARAFNHVAREEVFVEPHALGIDAPTARVMSLADPTVKMSKSAPLERSRIHLTDSADEIASKIRRAVTDTDARILYDRTARPGVANLLDICADLRSTPPNSCSPSVASTAHRRSSSTPLTRLSSTLCRLASALPSSRARIDHDRYSFVSMARNALASTRSVSCKNQNQSLVYRNDIMRDERERERHTQFFFCLNFFSSQHRLLIVALTRKSQQVSK
jgi:tryptophanyl-tRNA synthetase